MRPIKKGSTDQSVVIRIIDSTAGTPENGVDYDTSGIDLWYRREGAAKTSITEAALASLTAAHADGGIELIGDGYYRLDLPDAAVASGANGVMVGGTVTGMIVIGCYVQLVDFNPYDSVRMGMTALPNAAADAAGGLPISDAGGLDMDAILADTNELQSDNIPATLATIAGYIDTEITSIKTVTDNLPDSGALTSIAQASVCTEARLAELDAANLPADVASRASQSSVDVIDSIVDAILVDTGTDLPATLAAIAGYIDTEVAAIKAVTDNLPDSGALTSIAQESTIAALNNISVANILAGTVEGTLTVQQVMRIMFAVLAGKSTGGGTATITMRDQADTKARITATVDANGNRTNTVVDGT